jgi:predicted Zn-dependent protease
MAQSFSSDRFTLSQPRAPRIDPDQALRAFSALPCFLRHLIEAYAGMLLMSKGTVFPYIAWQPLAEQRVAELRARADDYRQMAITATTEPVKASLLRLSVRFDALADQKERSASC